MGGAMTTQSRFSVRSENAPSSRFSVRDDSSIEAASVEPGAVEVDQVPEQKPSLIDRISTMMKGGEEGRRNVFSAPELNELSMRAFKTGAGGLLTGNPQEIQQMIAKNYPEAEFKEIDGQLGVGLPSGDYLLQPKGVDPLDVARFGTQASAFMAGGPSASIGRAVAKDMATEAALEGVEKSVGGEFNVGDVAAAGAMSAGGELAMKGASQAGKAMFGKPTESAQQLIKSGEEFNIPVMTSDIYNPENWATRSLQFTGESVPIVGTGGLRNAQQEARDQAVDQFVSLHRGGSYEEIIKSIGEKSDSLKRAAGEVYNNVNPKLDDISRSSGGVPTDRTTQAIDDLSEYVTDPELKIGPNALALLDDMDFYLKSPKSYQSLRDNISAYQAKIDSIDPAIRDQLPTKLKAKFQSVLNAARADRDNFAQSNLSSREFAKLKQADSLYGEVAKNLKETKIKNILNKGDVTPEIASQMLYSNKPSEIKRLYENLTSDGRKNARSVIIGDIVNKIERRSGEISPTQMIGELRKNIETIDTFFRGSDRSQLDGFMKLMESTRRAQDVTKGSGSQTAERMLTGGVLGAGIFEPSILAGYGSVGALSRVYESPVMRNLLIRMNGESIGSPGFQKLASEAGEIFKASLQASPNKGDGVIGQTSEQVGEELNRAIQ